MSHLAVWLDLNGLVPECRRAAGRHFYGKNPWTSPQELQMMQSQVGDAHSRLKKVATPLCSCARRCRNV
jgi:hypothetical protein